MVSLASIGRSSVSTLCSVLTNGDTSLKAGVIGYLGSMGPDAQSAIPDLIRLTCDPALFVRCEAISALGRIKMDGAQVIPILIRSLHDENDRARAQAAEALGAWGAEAKASMPELRRIISEEPGDNLDSSNLHERARVALSLIDPMVAERLGPKIEIAMPPLRDQLMPHRPPEDKNKLEP